MIKVVAAVIRNAEGKILIARKRKGKSHEGLWEFPGGKIEANENKEAAVLREINEELNFEITIYKELPSFVYSYSNSQIRFFNFLCDYKAGTMKLSDHDRIEWIKLSETGNYEFAEADKKIIDLLKAVFN